MVWLRNLFFSVLTASRPLIRANTCRLSYVFSPKLIHKLTLNQNLVSKMDRPEIRADHAFSGKADEEGLSGDNKFGECGTILEQGPSGFRSVEEKQDEGGVAGKNADSPQQLPRCVSPGLLVGGAGLEGGVEGGAEILLKNREEATRGGEMEEEFVGTEFIGREEGRGVEESRGQCSTDFSRDSDQEAEGYSEREAGTKDLAAKLSVDERYRYIKRGFTSEIYKIEIRNLPKYMGYTVSCVVLEIPVFLQVLSNH